MALIVYEVTYSKNPVNVNEVFTIRVNVAETLDYVLLYSGTFYAGESIVL